MMGFEERYEISDKICGVIIYAATYDGARGTAGLIAKANHIDCGDILIYDRMAHKGKAEMWNQAGQILSIKEN